MNQYRTGGAGYYAGGYGVDIVPSLPSDAEAEDAWYTAGGALAPVAAYQPIGAASLAASYVNVANPGTYDATLLSATPPTFDALTGWTFASQYLNTGVVPAAGWSVIVRFSDITNTGNLIGERAAGDTRFLLSPRNSTKVYGYSGLAQIAPVITVGTMGLAGNACYADGVWVGATTGSTIAAYPLYIGTFNNAGTPSTATIVGKIQAIAIYNSVLDAAQMNAVHTAMMTL